VLDGKDDESVWKLAPRSTASGSRAPARVPSRATGRSACGLRCTTPVRVRPRLRPTSRQHHQSPGATRRVHVVRPGHTHAGLVPRPPYGLRVHREPAGVKVDVATYNDGNEDTAWDAVWDVATASTRSGGRRVPDCSVEEIQRTGGPRQRLLRQRGDDAGRRLGSITTRTVRAGLHEQPAETRPPCRPAILRSRQRRTRFPGQPAPPERYVVTAAVHCGRAESTAVSSLRKSMRRYTSVGERRALPAVSPSGGSGPLWVPMLVSRTL
jgi:hypothetical protein